MAGSNHYGIAGWYTIKAVEKGLIVSKLWFSLIFQSLIANKAESWFYDCLFVWSILDFNGVVELKN